jgi:hypothetical protein
MSGSLGVRAMPTWNAMVADIPQSLRSLACDRVKMTNQFVCIAADTPTGLWRFARQR